MSAVPRLRWVMPTNGYELVLQFENDEFRVFDSTASKIATGIPFPGSPHSLKAMRFTADAVSWKNGVTVDHAFLHAHSRAVSVTALCRECLVIGMCNRAPTAEDRTHHVYAVAIHPFAERVFAIGESIGGGHAERGGSHFVSALELLAIPDWKRHFALADCQWAVPIVENRTGDEPALMRALVDKFCRRD